MLTDLEMAREYLLWAQQKLYEVRCHRVYTTLMGRSAERVVLAALSWVWSAQEQERVIKLALPNGP